MKSEKDNITIGIFPKLLFIVLLLFSIHFWDIKYIPQMYKAENMVTWLICGYSIFMLSQNQILRFKNAILLFVIGIFANVLAAYINLGQSPLKTILSFEYYYFILLYFLLHYFKFDRKFLENIIIVFAIIYSLIYILQAEVYPFYILKSNVVRFDKGEFQFAILGHGFLMLAYFLLLNKYLLNRKLINILIAIGFFVVLLMSNYRTLIGGGVLLTVFMLIKIVKFNAKDFAILFFVILLFVGLSQFSGVTHVFDESITYTKQNLAEGKNYVRMVQMDFFFKKYPANLSYFILGGGKPSGENLYHFNPEIIRMNYNIIWVDIGLLGFYMVIGGIALSGLLWYTIKAIFIKLPKDKLYLNFYFLYLLIVSFTNEEIYRDGIFAVHAIGLYLIDLAANEKLTTDDETAIKGTLPSVKR